MINQEISRRDFLKCSSASTLSYLAAPYVFSDVSHAKDQEPHFVLQVVFPGGMDTHYLFDARPLEMTKEKLIQNYIGEEPNMWIGRNGQSTLATKLTNPLKPYKNYFSVINGVVMEPTFDGHEQNMSFWYTGNPFGGEFYLPYLNSSNLPLDYVELGKGKVFVLMSNTSKGVPLSNKSVAGLIEKMKMVPKLGPKNQLFSYLSQRMSTISKTGTGGFSGGAWAMHDALKAVPDLASRIERMELERIQEEQTKHSITLMSQLFKTGIAKSASLVFDTDLSDDINLDTHSGEDAKGLPEDLTKLMGEVATVFKSLKDTAYDEKRSMLDVTTVLVTTEFARTMRQNGTEFDDCGTDHNPLTNTVLIGGKGIKGGMVVGSSDYESTKAEISAAHKSFDPYLLKIMGKPFDFDAMKSRTDLPKTYNPKDYLTASCVINTVYKMFGVSSKHYRLIERNGAVARTLDGILV